MKSTKKRNNLLRKLGRYLASFATVTTDKGVLAWDGDEDLKAGDRVYIEDADGNRVEAADGDYKTEDGKTIVVADGAVAEIRDPEAEVAPAGEPAAEFGSKGTDKGTIYWDGEEDLKEGDAVFVENEAGERQPAPDGDYATEDGKVITVADGIVSAIRDKEAEVAPEEPEALRRHKVRANFEASFEEHYEAIYKALRDLGLDWPYIEEAGDTYVVVCVWTDEGEKLFRYALNFDADGKCFLGDSVEVKRAFVPLDFVSPFEGGDPAPTAEEVEQLRSENADLKAQVAKLSRVPLREHTRKGVTATSSITPGNTGDKRMDTLARYAKKP